MNLPSELMTLANPLPAEGQRLSKQLKCPTWKKRGCFTTGCHTKATALLAAMQQNLASLSDSSAQGKTWHRKVKVKTAALKLCWVLINPPPQWQEGLYQGLQFAPKALFLP